MFIWMAKFGAAYGVRTGIQSASTWWSICSMSDPAGW